MMISARGAESGSLVWLTFIRSRFLKLYWIGLEKRGTVDAVPLSRSAVPTVGQRYMYGITSCGCPCPSCGGIEALSLIICVVTPKKLQVLTKNFFFIYINE